jgi:hypothetical protein
MTPTQQWIMCLALVYAVPSFLSGVGITLLFVRWQDIRRAAARSPGFLALPWQTYEGRAFATADLAPADEGYLLPEGLRLL